MSGHSEADIKGMILLSLLNTHRCALTSFHPFSAFPAKVRQVKDLFPTISDDKAVQILHDCNYDVERTVNRLFDGETTETSSAEPSGDSWVESRSKKGRKKAQVQMGSGCNRVKGSDRSYYGRTTGCCRRQGQFISNFLYGRRLVAFGLPFRGIESMHVSVSLR